MTIAHSTTCPQWCTNCAPGLAEVPLYLSGVECWATDDSLISLGLLQSGDGPAMVALSTRSTLAGLLDGDVLLTIQEARDLITRIAALIDSASPRSFLYWRILSHISAFPGEGR